MVDSKSNAVEQQRQRKSPSPLLLSPKAMESALTKERMRCDRFGQFFSLIVILPNHVTSGDSLRQFRLLANILHKRLRLIDEKGLLLKGGLGVLLPMTEWHGAEVVLNSIIHAAKRNGLTFEAEVFTYSGKETFPNTQITEDRSSEPDSEIIFDDELRAEDTILESSANSSRSTVAMVETPDRVNAVIRVNHSSQTRRSGYGQMATTRTVPTTYICRQYPAWKRCMDVGFALLGLVISIPVILIVAIAIKLTSKGPIFFRQMRSGQFGNAFPIYKLRTMVVDAEELKEKLHPLNERDGPAFKIKNDPRVTRLGGLLRKTGIDELPQLWNVLVGHMAIVGPRPLPCNEDAMCKVWHRRRLDTKPGLTCIWQISKSRNISFSDWMRMDLKYTDKRTIASDIGLMFKTVLAVFLGRVGH